MFDNSIARHIVLLLFRVRSHWTLWWTSVTLWQIHQPNTPIRELGPKLRIILAIKKGSVFYCRYARLFNDRLGIKEVSCLQKLSSHTKTTSLDSSDFRHFWVFSEVFQKRNMLESDLSNNLHRIHQHRINSTPKKWNFNREKPNAENQSRFSNLTWPDVT